MLGSGPVDVEMGVKILYRSFSEHKDFPKDVGSSDLIKK
jgi:hypothetical protein